MEIYGRERETRERCRCHRWSKAGHCAVENVEPRSYTMSGRLMRLRGNGTRRTKQEEKREREREGQHGARCIGRRTNLCRATLMSAFVLFQRVYTLRIRSVETNPTFDREISFRTFIHSRDSRIRISSYTFYYSAQRFVAMFTYLN